ncbi:uncharacterized protein LOC135470001 [Liolophura sinensis]|uniref:uncharacterized protein LOC135470001 n=1 Tax=Liolophura sinensis TaxID=3198878 RepID=UPI00315872E8
MALLFKLSVIDDFQNKMKDTLVTKYGFHIDSPENKIVTDIWNVMQRKLQCCGVSGNANSSTSWAIYKLESHWYTQFVTGRPYVPDTCCRPFSDDNICTGLRPIKGLPSLGPTALHNITMQDNPNINTNGCSEKIQDIPKRDILIVLIFSAVLATLSIINLTMSLCLCKNPRQYDFR